MPRGVAFLSTLLWLAACREGKAPSAPGMSPSGSPSSPSIEAARITLEGPCGQCHIGTYPTSLPRALAVFDLAEEDAFARMTDAQLLDADHRLGSALLPDGEVNEVPAGDRDLFHQFVREELARRRASKAVIPSRP